MIGSRELDRALERYLALDRDHPDDLPGDCHMDLTCVELDLDPDALFRFVGRVVGKTAEVAREEYEPNLAAVMWAVGMEMFMLGRLSALPESEERRSAA